jgi:hypothetical protein
VPSNPNILSIPTVKAYFIVSNIAAMGGGWGLGPKIAMAPIMMPHSAVRATAEMKMMLKRSFTTLSQCLEFERRTYGKSANKKVNSG